MDLDKGNAGKIAFHRYMICLPTFFSPMKAGVGIKRWCIHFSVSSRSSNFQNGTQWFKDSNWWCMTVSNCNPSLQPCALMASVWSTSLIHGRPPKMHSSAGNACFSRNYLDSKLSSRIGIHSIVAQLCFLPDSLGFSMGHKTPNRCKHCQWQCMEPATPML